eukprot:TRINITY_DN17270_c0_g1_i1.p1 TRINITY_DN17270_c0_g1~~TRINITY_DN17270_c0_g1_i1.p1  ORF type:complete len:530 (-),score=-24.84 TRINITY_DN17270_c0_g1_i1:33-1511(-)
MVIPHEQAPEYLPIISTDFKNLDLFKALKDGKLLALLVNIIEPNTIDMRVIDYSKYDGAKKSAHIRDNLNLILKSCSSVGVSVGRVNAINFENYEDSLHLILGCLWQLLKKVVMKNIDLHINENLFRLLKDGETIDHLIEMRREDLLTRWVNFQLEEAESPRRMKDLKSSLKDGLIYLDLLSHIGQTNELKDYYNKAPIERIKAVMDHVKNKYDIKIYFSPDLIENGNDKINTILLASIYNANPFLEDIDQKIQFEDNLETDNEKKIIINWLICNLPEYDIDNIYEIASIGIWPLEIISKITRKEINEKVIKRKPRNINERIDNCNYLMKEFRAAFDYDLKALKGESLAKKDKKIVHSFYLLCMLQQAMKIIEETQVDGKRITESYIKNWAKERIAKISPNLDTKNFKTIDWKNGLNMITLLKSIKPKVIDENLIAFDNPTDEEKIKNISYAITVAKKIGALVFCSAKTFLKGSDKMVQLFVIEMIKLNMNK